MTALAHETLGDWASTLLERAGASPEAAGAAAESLVDANRRGLDSHGVALLSFYLPRLASGAVDGRARPEVVADFPAAALVDGRNAPGAFVARFAVDLCCDKAVQSGAAVVVVRNSNHFGATSCYSERAVRRGCVGIAATNCPPGLAPLGALGPLLGTNPLAIAAPPGAGGIMPSLDIASSVVAVGRISMAGRAGARLPPGWAVGADGAPTDDPEEALRGAALPMGGYKGFGLAFMIDVLAGCLSGAPPSPWIQADEGSPQPERAGHFFAAIHVGRFRDERAYAQDLERLVEAVHSAARAPGIEPFMIPGERETRTAAARANEIPFDEATAGLLRSLGEEFGAPFPG